MVLHLRSSSAVESIQDLHLDFRPHGGLSGVEETLASTVAKELVICLSDFRQFFLFLDAKPLRLKLNRNGSVQEVMCGA